MAASTMRCILTGLLLWPVGSLAQKIAFESDRDGGWRDVFVMETDGSNAFNVTHSASVDDDPRWSPDGTRIAFHSRRDGNDEVYVVDVNGENPTNLSNHPSIDHHPRWSPDGTVILFESYREGNAEIYSVSAEGRGKSKHGPCGPPPGSGKKCGAVFNLTNNPYYDLDPRWSPDGSRIVFLSLRDGNEELYAMDSDGRNPTRLTNNPAQDFDPIWLPDGSKIAFRSTRDGNSEIYVMDADGSNQTNLTNDPALEHEMQWSPDGMSVVFVRTVLGYSDIYAMDFDGGNRRSLTGAAGKNFSPQWSPDGTRIAFLSYRDPSPEIYVMNADGSSPTNLTNHWRNDYAPRWAPGPRPAEKLIGDLMAEVRALAEAGILANGETNRLERPLENAARSLGFPHEQAACAQLQRFADAALEMTPVPIPVMTADEWIADVQRIRTMLGCSAPW